MATMTCGISKEQTGVLYRRFLKKQMIRHERRMNKRVEVSKEDDTNLKPVRRYSGWD